MITSIFPVKAAWRLLPGLWASLAAGVASAAAVSFSGTGLVNPGPGFDPFSSPWPLVATSVNGYTVGGDAGWNFVSNFDVDVVFGPGGPMPTGGTGDFALTDSDSADGLFGTVTTTATPSGFSIAYTVTSGSGAWSGYAGSGSSSVLFTSDPRVFPTSYVEVEGLLNLVPEPASGVLVLAAGGAWAALRRRRDASSCPTPAGA